MRLSGVFEFTDLERPSVRRVPKDHWAAACCCATSDDDKDEGATTRRGDLTAALDSKWVLEWVICKNAKCPRENRDEQRRTDWETTRTLLADDDDHHLHFMSDARVWSGPEPHSNVRRRSHRNPSVRIIFQCRCSFTEQSIETMGSFLSSSAARQAVRDSQVALPGLECNSSAGIERENGNKSSKIMRMRTRVGVLLPQGQVVMGI